MARAGLKQHGNRRLVQNTRGRWPREVSVVRLWLALGRAYGVPAGTVHPGGRAPVRRPRRPWHPLGGIRGGIYRAGVPAVTVAHAVTVPRLSHFWRRARSPQANGHVACFYFW